MDLGECRISWVVELMAMVMVIRGAVRGGSLRLAVELYKSEKWLLVELINISL